MPRILVVDDEADIVNLIERYAVREGYEVDKASDGAEAVASCEKSDYDAIVMDVMMQEVDGFTACKRIRAIKDIPVIMLSAKGTEVDKLYGFEVGIDDYVTKPFSPNELMARLKVVIKRHGSRKDEQALSVPAGKSGVYAKTAVIPGKTAVASAEAAGASGIEAQDRFLVSDGIRVDILGYNVLIDGEKAELTSKEYALLVYLMRNRGIVLSREQILNAVWGYEFFGEDRTVDWQMKLLRGKLGKYRDRIHTIRGVGYKFED